MCTTQVCVLLLFLSDHMFMNVMRRFQTNFRNKAQLSSFWLNSAGKWGVKYRRCHLCRLPLLCLISALMVDTPLFHSGLVTTADFAPSVTWYLVVPSWLLMEGNWANHEKQISERETGDGKKERKEGRNELIKAGVDTGRKSAIPWWDRQSKSMEARWIIDEIIKLSKDLCAN